MKLHNLNILLFFGLLFGLMACDSDAAVKKDKIVGKWELAEAIRGGKIVTEQLEGTYFEFNKNNEMKTNLPVFISEQTSKFEIKDQVLKQLGDRPIDYKIEMLEDQLLVISTDISGFPFKFTLKKK